MITQSLACFCDIITPSLCQTFCTGTFCFLSVGWIAKPVLTLGGPSGFIFFLCSLSRTLFLSYSDKDTKSSCTHMLTGLMHTWRAVQGWKYDAPNSRNKDHSKVEPPNRVIWQECHCYSSCVQGHLGTLWSSALTVTRLIQLSNQLPLTPQ